MPTYIELKQQIDALHEQADELQKQADELKASERQGVIDRMKEAIAVYGITALELGLGGRGGAGQKRGRKSRVAAAKTVAKGKAGEAAYRDQEGNTWGGRGPRPKWLKTALASGAKLEDFASQRAK